MSSKKPTKTGKSKVPVSNAFASLSSSLVSDPDEEQSSEQLLREQQEQQIQNLGDLRTKELAIESQLAALDAQQGVKPRHPTPINSPFDPSVDKVRRYGVIKEEDAAGIENSIFQRLRASMFKTGKGGMFMFGTPDSVVLNLLLRMYNENIIRIAKEIPPASPDLSAMLGVLNIDGAIYVTLSEDPREDDTYYRKTQLIYTLLKYTNCNVIYDEEEDDDPDVRSAFGSKWAHLFGLVSNQP